MGLFFKDNYREEMIQKRDNAINDSWLDGEPDWDRYENDLDYALGADDAMDEFDW